MISFLVTEIVATLPSRKTLSEIINQKKKNYAKAPDQNSINIVGYK